MILRLAPKTAALVGGTPAEWQLLESPLARERGMRKTQPVLAELRLEGRGHNPLDRFKAKGLQEDRQPPLTSALYHGVPLHPGDEDDGQERVASPDRLHDRPPAHCGHGDVEEDQIPAPLIEVTQPAHAVTGHLTLVSERGEQVRQHLSHVLIVVDQEHAGTASIRH